MLTCICVRHLIKIYRVVQELCTFTFTDHGGMDGQTIPLKENVLLLFFIACSMGSV